MNFPDDLKYTSEHEWVRFTGAKTDDGRQVVEIGITDFAQGELGELVYIELNIAIDEAAELDADQADQLAALVHIRKQFQRMSDEGACLCRVCDTPLLCIGVEISITYFDRNAAGQTGILTQVESELINHPTEHTADKLHIECILAKGALFGH